MPFSRYHYRLQRQERMADPPRMERLGIGVWGVGWLDGGKPFCRLLNTVFADTASLGGEPGHHLFMWSPHALCTHVHALALLLAGSRRRSASIAMIWWCSWPVGIRGCCCCCCCCCCMTPTTTTTDGWRPWWRLWQRGMFDDKFVCVSIMCFDVSFVVVVVLTWAWNVRA